jgi:hypothetical protein
MQLPRKRTLAAIAALSTASAAVMALSSSPANALQGIDVTVSSSNGASVVIPVDGHGTYIIKNAAVGDVLTFTPASTTPFSAIAQANTAAGLATASLVGGAQAFANIAGAVLGSFPGGTPQNFTLANYSPAAPLAAFGVSGGQLDQGVVNAGLANVAAVANASTQAQYAVVMIQFGNQNPNVTTTLTASNSHAGGSVTLGGTHFWGSPVNGDGTAAAQGAGIPDPTILLDGSPIAGSASITAAALDASGALNPGGVLSGSVTLPNNIAAGTHSLTVVEPNTTPYNGNGPSNTVTASTTFNVAGPTATASPATAQDGTVVAITGDNFAPNLGASLSFTTGSDTGTATVDGNGHLTGSITVHTANEALGSNDVHVVQSTSGLTATAALSISSIPTLHQTINAQVLPGSGLGDTQSGSTVDMGNTVLNGHVQTRTGDLNQVTVTDTRGTNVGWTLTGQLEGDFVNGTPGNENGNTFATGVEPNSHNKIPASNLSWTPSVSLAVPTDGLPGDVAPGSATALSKSAAKTLAIAALGGGGGTWQADASLSLVVPSYVNKGTYSAILDLVLG